MRKAELITAWRYICAECGDENWVRGIGLDMDARPDLAEQVEGLEGDWMLCPDFVKCRTCKTVFETTHGEDDGNDDTP